MTLEAETVEDYFDVATDVDESASAAHAASRTQVELDVEQKEAVAVAHRDDENYATDSIAEAALPLKLNAVAGV